MNTTPYLGHYRLMNQMSIEIVEIDDGLAAAFPGVPAGFEVRLTPLEEPHTFRMLSGPLPGVTGTFRFPAEGGPAQAFQVAHFELPRGSGPQPGDLAYLLPPTLDLDPQQEAAFAALWATIQDGPAGAEIRYDLPYPVHEFLMYLTGREAFIFHGSNNADIEEFVPLRKSFELRDPTGRGNLPAVYGTHDALWAMWFAILDRGRMQGSTQNGVLYFHNPAGESVSVYQFSISQESIPLQPFTAGMLYLLPRDAFRRLELADGAPANEWASDAPVRPLAKLRVRPEEFPFLDQVAGHSDPELMALGAATDQVLAAVTAHDLTGAQLTLTLNFDEGSAAAIADYLRLMRIISPTAAMTLHIPAGDGPATLTIQASPAYLQVMQNRLSKE